MDNTLVSARVPKAKKEAAARLLERDGATMSDLINDAIDSLLSKGAYEPSREDSTPTKRDFTAFMQRTTVEVSWPSDTPDDYRDLEREWRRHDYDSLA